MSKNYSVKSLEDDLSRNLRKASIYLVARIKENLSVPAPRKSEYIRDRHGKTIGVKYTATKKATAGAFPRKLSGRLRASITYQMNPGGKSSRVGTNVEYAYYLSIPRYNKKAGRDLSHEFLARTLNQYSSEIASIIVKGHV